VSYYFRDVVLLKKPDRGNAGRARIKTGPSVLKGDAAQGKDGDILTASFTQSIEAGRAGSRGILLFEDRGKNGKVCSLGSSASNLGRGVARNSDNRASRIPGVSQNLPYFRWRNIIGPQMHSVSAASYRDVGP
jgi:hypothetical protein